MDVDFSNDARNDVSICLRIEKSKKKKKKEKHVSWEEG